MSSVGRWMRREQPIAWVPATERLWLTTWDLCAEAGAADEISGPTTAVHELVYGLVYALDEIVGTVGTMIVGGFQEPAHGAANALLGLLGRPEQAAAVAADPMGLSAATVHEGLRWIPPFNMTEKLTAADVVIGGKMIPAGTEIAMVIGSANRDETRFEHPDVFDLHATGRTTSRSASGRTSASATTSRARSRRSPSRSSSRGSPASGSIRTASPSSTA
ncbi:MAG TPA: cytochrome P450 [Gaiellales bacterium]|nr:cytochrome P450 [Gaiellales bacterium]